MMERLALSEILPYLGEIALLGPCNEETLTEQEYLGRQKEYL